MAPSGGQICNSCKWCHVVAKLSPSLGVNFWVRCASGNVFLINNFPIYKFLKNKNKNEKGESEGYSLSEWGWNELQLGNCFMAISLPREKLVYLERQLNNSSKDLYLHQKICILSKDLYLH